MHLVKRYPWLYFCLLCSSASWSIRSLVGIEWKIITMLFKTFLSLGHLEAFLLLHSTSDYFFSLISDSKTWGSITWYMKCALEIKDPHLNFFSVILDVVMEVHRQKKKRKLGRGQSQGWWKIMDEKFSLKEENVSKEIILLWRQWFFATPAKQDLFIVYRPVSTVHFSHFIF